MNNRRLNIRDDVKLRLEVIRESLAGVILDNEDMSKVTGGCGGICYITCSYYCESSCMGSCMTFSDYDPNTGGLRGPYCAQLPKQNQLDWRHIIRYAR
jgi:hypothetical protein